MNSRRLLKESLQETWRKLPSWVASSSAERTRYFKSSYEKVMAILKKSNPSEDDLKRAELITKDIYT